MKNTIKIMYREKNSNQHFRYLSGYIKQEGQNCMGRNVEEIEKDSFMAYRSGKWLASGSHNYSPL